METRPASRPVWPFILGAVLLLLLIVLVARSCRQDYGETPPPFGDTLDTDTTMGPMDEEGYGPTDTALYDRNDRVDTADTALNGENDTVEDPQVPPGPPAMPSTPGGTSVP